MAQAVHEAGQQRQEHMDQAVDQTGLQHWAVKTAPKMADVADDLSLQLQCASFPDVTLVHGTSASFTSGTLVHGTEPPSPRLLSSTARIASFASATLVQGPSLSCEDRRYPPVERGLAGACCS